MNWQTIILFLLAYALTVWGVGLWRRLAVRREILDIPNKRSSHVRPTPKGGGIVIVAVTIAILVFAAWQGGILFDIAPLLGGAVLIAVVSWFDDLKPLPSILRFAVHTVAALIAIYSVGYFNFIEVPFVTINWSDSLRGQIVTLLWIVGLTNAYNFMDGIDGIAGTQGLTAGLGWALIGFFIGQPFIVLFGGLLAASSLGFLWHNWHPAKIFMGDVSSAFLGYSFAVLPLLAMKYSDQDDARFPVIGVVLVWTFVFDAVLTFLRRAWRRENIFAAHRSHLYQRLVIAGFKHDSVSLLYGFLSILGIIISWIWLSINENALKAVLLLFILLMAGGLWGFVRTAETRLNLK